MKLDLHELSSDYHNQGLTYIDGLIPEEVCDDWANQIKASAEVIGNQALAEEQEIEVGKFPKEAQNYYVISGDETKKNPILASMFDYYYAFLPLLSAITGRDVTASPYEKSIINCKLYKAEDRGCQGWHYDTNGITLEVVGGS